MHEQKEHGLQLGTINVRGCDGQQREAFVTLMQWHKKMFLNRGTVNKIARKAHKIFLDHTIRLQTMHYYATCNLAVK